MLVGIRIVLVTALLLTVSVPSPAEELPLFQQDEILKAVLTGPISQAYAQKGQKARIYHPGQWSYIDENGESARLDVSIRARGNFRRMYCDLAPLQLNFKKSQVKGTLFAGQNKVKLVAPCFDTPSFQRYVLLEYVAYRILEILTDHSYRTRLIRLSYVDSDENLKPWTSVVFVIEDDADMAQRLGLERIKVPRVRFDELDREKTAVAELFQLLIGNNDYSVLKTSAGEDCCHNSDVLAVDEADLKIPIPFDFDFSGLVDAPYAAPPSHLPIKEVRHRYYTGLCHPVGVLEDAIAHFQSKREEIFAFIENLKELSVRGRRDARYYVENFYDLLDKPKRLEKEVYERCRGRHLLEAMERRATDPT